MCAIKQHAGICMFRQTLCMSERARGGGEREKEREREEGEEGEREREGGREREREREREGERGREMTLPTRRDRRSIARHSVIQRHKITMHASRVGPTYPQEC